MEKEKQISKLNKKLEFYKVEVARLSVELCFSGSPISRLMIEEHKQEALQQIELIKKVIEHLSSDIDTPKDGTIETEILEGISEEKNISESTSPLNTTKNPPDKKPPSGKEKKEWYQRPIGIIGLTVTGGIILAFAKYIIEKHIGLPIK